MDTDVRLSTVELCSMVAQLEWADCYVRSILELSVNLLLLTAEGVERERLIEAMEHLHLL